MRISAIAKHLGGKRRLAEVAGLSESQLHRIVSGESKVKIDALAAIAKAADVSLDWLAMGQGPKWIISPPQNISEVVQRMREFIDAIVYDINDEKIIDRNIELEGDALAYVEQLAIMSLGKHCNAETDGDKFVRVAASIEAISGMMMKYGDDTVSARLHHAIMKAAVDHGMNVSATCLILDAIASDVK